MEQLVHDLNSPQNQGRPDAINLIQRQIQQLQRQPSAWQSGLDLLSSDQQVLQFYGALTIGLKVNADWDADEIGTNRHMVSELIQILVTSYVTLSLQPSTSDLVVNKLSTVLAAIFAKPDAAWSHPCRHVLACMLAGRYIPQTDAPMVAQILSADASISARALRAVLRLGLALQEDNTASAQNKTGHRYEVQISNNAKDAWQILTFALAWICKYTQHISASASRTGLQVQDMDATYMRLLEEICQQIPLWAKYVGPDTSPALSTSCLFISSMKFLITTLEQNQLAELVMPCLTTLQTDHSRLMARSVPRFSRQVNDSAAARTFRSDFITGNFTIEAISYVELLEAVVSQVDLTRDDYLKDEDLLMILQIVQEIFKIEGAAVVEDEICQMLLEMMTSVAEGYSDWNEPSPFDQGMTSLIKDICASTLRKVRYPEQQLDKQTATWTEDDFTKFEDFRFSASDFFQTAFGILGSPLGMDIAFSITQKGEFEAAENDHVAWSDFEAAIFGLTSLSDALSNESEQCDPCLRLVFESGSWIEGITTPEQIPGRVRRAIIRLLGETTTFLQRNPQFLVTSLDFLFRSLQVKTHSSHAAKAIYNLCDSQRSLLVQALPQFLQTLTTLEHIPLGSRCKVLSGVAALVQALPTEASKIEPLDKMLLLVQNLENTTPKDAVSAVDDTTNPLFDRVSMIAALAKGLQSPADAPIDLDSTESTSSTFWTEGEGCVVQRMVIQMLSEPWRHLSDIDGADLVTAACDFLRAGFKEQHPSPLKFSSSASIELLTTLIDLQNPNLDQTMNTTSCYVSSAPAPSSSPQASTEADTLITAILAITKEATNLLSQPAANPDFSAPTSILDFFIRSSPKYGLHIFTHPSASEIIEPVINFALILLRSTTDTLPRRSAAAYFTALVDLSDPASKISTDPTASSTHRAFFEKYAPTILGLVLHLVAGECARSEIESLTETLRRFVLRQPMQTKRIMQEAMKMESGVLTEKALNATKPEQRARFIAQVEGLRGAKKTNEIVREFWVSCKGGQFGYIA